MKKVLVFLLLVFSSFTMMGFSLGEEKLKEIAARLAFMKVPEDGVSLYDRKKKTYSGFEFKKLYPGTFLKLMTSNENHRGFQYKDGVCTDKNPFCNNGSCVAGGLYFTDIWRIQNYYTNGQYDHFREIVIPDLAVVYVDKGKFRASRICLTTRGISQNREGLTADVRELISAVVQRFYKDNPEHLLLKEVDFYMANLQGANLNKANLQGANLQGAKLQWAKLQKAKLQGAKLQKAKLQGAKLQGAKLQGANLQGAKLQGAKLNKANLNKANLYEAELLVADLQRAKLQGANLLGANLLGAKLLGANLLGANLLGADLQGANLQGANLQGADLLGADLQRAKLQGATIDWERKEKVLKVYLQRHGALNIDKCILFE